MTIERFRLDLLAFLKERQYEFVAVTPRTHGRILARECVSPDLRDIFGWNREFREDQVEPALLRLMRGAGVLCDTVDGHRSFLRVASLGSTLFFHSAFPTDDTDAVFFGPDTYRFVNFVVRHLPNLTPIEIADLGAGTGAAGVAIAQLVPSASIVLIDVNPAALDLARLNALAAGVSLDLELGSLITASCDIVVANPPYMMDRHGRRYRDGGELLGGAVALEWARHSLEMLLPGGALLLYTGVPYVAGEAPLMAALADLCDEAGASLCAEEIDPDVFGEELSEPAYRDVERIAATGFVIQAAC